jgi:cyclic di-GMP phosphodiesterase
MIHAKPLVLVADDEETIRELLYQVLINLGYDVALAEDGAEALEIIRNTPPDLILSDVMMPKVDGFELCAKVKEDRFTRLIPVVLLTGLGGIDDRVKGIDSGADDFISKPFQMVELAARLRSLLRLKQFTDELEHAEKVIFSLALAVEAKDSYTQGHCARLAYYGQEVGKILGLDESDMQAIHRGGFLHDIGKIGMPDSILLKPGPLTPEEFIEVRKHPAKGEEICKPLRTLTSVLPIIRHHHERIDGDGYPDKIAGNDIPLNARIVSCVDYVDALSTKRPYRDALPTNEVISMLREAVITGHLDSDIAKIIEEIMKTQKSDWLAITTSL